MVELSGSLEYFTCNNNENKTHLERETTKLQREIDIKTSRFRERKIPWLLRLQEMTLSFSFGVERKGKR